MWFKLASATFSTHLGSMSSLSNSISIKYTANGFSYTTNSVSKTASSASLVLNLMSGWECKSTPTVNVSGAAVVNGTPTWSSGKLTIAIKPASSKSTFAAAGTIINVSVSGATAISGGGSGGGTTDPTPGGDTTSFDFTTATWQYNRYIKETTGGYAGGAAEGQAGHGTYTVCDAFIPVVGGTTYCLTLNGVAKKSRFWAWYTDANADSFISGDSTTIENRTAPENAKYVRITLMAPYFYTAAEQTVDENGKLTNPDPSTIKLVPVS